VAHEFAVIAYEMIRRKDRHVCVAGDSGQSQKGIQDCGCRSSVRGLNHQILREYLIEQIAVMAFVCKVEHGENPILADCDAKGEDEFVPAAMYCLSRGKTASGWHRRLCAGLLPTGACRHLRRE
jgi:hypothetical protein